MNTNSKNIKRYLPLLIIILSVTLSIILSIIKKEEKKEIVDYFIPRIDTFKANKRNFQIYLEKEGHIVSKYEYPLISEVNGRILYLSDYFNNNLIFDKNELLVQVDSSYYSIDRRNAKALLNAAVLDNEMQSAIYQRSKIELSEYGQKDASDLAKKIPQLNSSESKLDAAKANYEKTLLNLDKTSIRAPFRGRIKNNQASKGMVVSQGMKLATIYSVEDLVLSLPLQLDELNFLSDFKNNDIYDNIKINISLNVGDEVYNLEGNYEGISGSVDRLTQSVTLNVSLDDLKKIGLIVDNNLFVNSRIYGKNYPDVYVLPNIAINDDYSIHIVENNRLFSKKIEIIKEYKDSTVVRFSSSKDSQLINITPLDYYIDSMKVKVSP